MDWQDLPISAQERLTKVTRPWLLTFWQPGVLHDWILLMTGTCRAGPAVAYILYLAANSGMLKMTGRPGNPR
jgi:hypothetical protein